MALNDLEFSVAVANVLPFVCEVIQDFVSMHFKMFFMRLFKFLRASLKNYNPITPIKKKV